MSSNSGRSSVPGITSLQARGHLTPTSYSSAISGLSHNQVKVKVTLRLTVGQSVSLGVEPHLGLMSRYLLLFDSYSLVCVGRPLWQEEGSVLYMLLGLTLSGPNPLGLVAIFYCLSFETSLYVASYDLQGHRPHRKHCFQQLSHCCVLHSHYLAMTVSQAPQFLLWTNMPQYDCFFSKVCEFSYRCNWTEACWFCWR
jgi:hypothetical protein